MSTSTSNKNKKKSSVVRARVDSDTKERVEDILEKLGLNTSKAIRLYLKQIEMHQGLPFSVNIPNDETRQAMSEAREGEDLEEFEMEKELN